MKKSRHLSLKKLLRSRGRPCVLRKGVSSRRSMTPRRGLQPENIQKEALKKTNLLKAACKQDIVSSDISDTDDEATKLST